MGEETSANGVGGVDGQALNLESTFFYHSAPALYSHYWEQYGIYERAHEDVLGEEIDDSESQVVSNGLATQSRCFNCGSLDHKVTECNFRLDRDLIALSRQYYQFFQGTFGLGHWKRIHTVEAWRQQRLDWAEEFEPGKIKGELLRDALESSNEDWLRNISVWGYPLGWINQTDPRELVKSRIWAENDGDIDDEVEKSQFFEIHGDDDRVENVLFRNVFQVSYNGEKIAANELSSGDELDDSKTISSSSFPGDGSKLTSLRPLVRWAEYPSSYFSSQHLIPYQPPQVISIETWANTSFEDSVAYLNQFQVPPPPPPTDEPPPLPPSYSPPPLPADPPPPPSHSSRDPVIADRLAFPDLTDLSESDMDMSDSD